MRTNVPRRTPTASKLAKPVLAPVRKPTRIAPLATAILAASFPSIVHAATATWTGTSGATWDTSATNWSANVTGTPWDVTNGGANAALFNTASATASVSGTVWANSLTFSQAATISNGTITLAGATPTITTTATATIASVLAGSAGFTKAGAGTLILSGSNTFTGGITFDSIANASIPSVVTVTGSTSLGTGSKTVSLTNYGRTLALDGSGGNITLGSNISYTISNSGISSGGYVAAPALQNLRGDNTIQGAIAVTSGGGGLKVQSDAGTLTLTGVITTNYAGRVFVLDGSANGVISGNMPDASGGATLTKQGAGTWTLSGADNFSGGITISQGALTIGGAGQLGSGTYSGSISNAATFNYSSSAAQTLSGAISGTGTLVQSGSGTLTLSGSNSYSGGTNITSGVLSISSTASLPGWSTGKFNVASGAALAVGNAFSDANVTTILSSGTFAAGASFGYDTTAGNRSVGSIGGALGLVKIGGNTLTLTGSNSYTGATTVVSGTLALGPSAVLSSATSGLILGGGALDLGASSQTVGAVSITAAAAAGDTVLNGTLSGTSFAVSNTSGTAVLSANLAGVGALTKFGAGNCILSGSNSYSGGTQINAGTLTVGSANSLPLSGITVSGSAVLAVNNAVNDTAVTAILGGASFAPGAVFGFDTTAGNRSVGSIGGALGLVKIGGNTLTLTGSNSYTGATTVVSGTLALGPSAVLSSATSGLILGGGALDLGASSQTVGAVSITAAAAAGDTVLNGTLSGTSFAVSNTSGTAVLSANLAGVGALTKFGAGALWLSGSNTLSGGVTINAGAIQVNNPNALGTGTLTINNGATSTMHFAASGTVANPMSINEAFTITNDGSNSLTLTGNINGNGNAVNLRNATASGTITLTGSNSFNINGFDPALGTLRLGSNYALGNGTVTRLTAGVKLVLLDGVSCNNIIAQNSNWFGMDASGTAAFTNQVFPVGAYTVSTPAGSQLSFPQLYSTGTLNKVGAGTAILTSVSDSPQALVLSGGVLRIPGVGAIGTSGSYSITLDGGTLQYVTGGSGTTAMPIAMTANGGAFDASGSGPVTYSSTAAVLYTGSGNRTLTLTGTNTGSNTLAAAIADSGTGTVALAKTGPGTWVLSGSNSYSGGTQINAGTLSIVGLNSLPAGAVTVSSSAALAIGNGVSDTAVPSILGGASFASGASFGYDTTAGDRTAGSNIAGQFGLVKIAANTLTLTGSNTFTGGVTVAAGALQVNNPNALGTGTLTINNGTTSPMHFATSGTVANSMSINQAFTITNDGSNILTLTGNITGNNGTVSVNNATASGTITLTGSNKFNGDFYGTAGTYRIGSNTAYGGVTWRPDSAVRVMLLDGITFSAPVAPSGSVTGKTFYLGMDTSGTAVFNNYVYPLGAGGATDIDTAAGAQLTFNLVYGSNGLLVKTGSGTAILPSNGGTGPVTISAGVFQVASLTNGGVACGLGQQTSSGTNLIVDGGTLRYAGGTGSTDRQFTLTASGGGLDASGSGPITLASTAAVAYTGSGNRTLNLIGSNTGQNTLAAYVADSGAGTVALAKSGAGTWVLSSSNSYSGGTVVSNGVLIAGNANALGSGAAIVNGGVLEFASPWWSSMASVAVNSGGALGLAVGGSTGFTTSDIDTVFSGSSGAVLNPGTFIALDPSNNGGTFTYSSVISGSTGLAKIGSNNLVLSSSNTYLGPTRISQAALTNAVLANGGQPSSIGASTSAASNLIIENGGQFYASGTTDRLFTLGSSGQACVGNAGGVLVFSNTGDIAVSGSASHNLRLTGNVTNTFAPAIHDYNSSNKTQLSVQNNTWLVTGTASDYTGVTNIDAAGTLVATVLVNGGVPSSIGASTSAASNLVFGYDASGGNNTLRYAGAGAASTDRLFTLGSFLGAGAVTTIDNSGGDTLSFTNTGTISVATTASTTLALTGSTATINFAPAIVNGAGTVGVAKNGPFTVTLTGSNTYTGATSVTGGTLQVGNGGTTGSIASTSSVSISSGATLAFARTDNYGGSFTKNISGAGNLAVNSGSLTLTGSNTYTGATTVAPGLTLQIGDGVTGAMASTVTLNNGSTLGINLPNGGVYSSGINIGPGTVNLTSSGTNFITGQINGYTYCILNQNGTGTSVLSYTNPFYGAANVNAGTLQLNAQYAAYNATVNVGASGLLTFGTNAVNVGALSGSGGVVLSNGTNAVTLNAGANNQSTVFAGNLSGPGSLTMAGTNSVFTLTGSNTYTGATTVSTGTLQIGNGGTTGSIASSGSISIASGATLAFNRSDDYGTVLSQPVTGSGRLLLASGSLTVSSTSAFTGDVVLASGATLLTGTNAPLSGANLDGEGGTLNIGPLVSASFGGLKGSGNLNIASTSGSAITLNVGGNGQTGTLNGSLSGSNLSLIKSGAGSLILGASNSIAGGVTVNGGAFQANDPNALGTGTLTINSGASGSLTFNTSGTVANPRSMNRSFTITNSGSNNLTLSGNITGTNGMLVNNATSFGTVTLTGSNKFSGDWGPTAGTFRIGNTHALDGINNVRPSASIKLVLLDGVTCSTVIAQSIAWLGMDTSGTATFTNYIYPTGNCTIDTVAGAQLSFTGDLLSSGTLIKTGDGTVILSNQYNAGQALVISGGVLQATRMSAIGTGTTYGTTLDGGTLKYTGATDSTARPLTITANGGAFDASGSGPVTYSSTAAVVYTGSGNRTLTLTGTNTGSNTLAASMADNGTDLVSLVKNGTGTWVLSGSNSYSGGTTLNAGQLNLNNANAIGTGGLTIVGGTLGNTSGAAVTLATNNTMAWNGDFAFAGTSDLNLGAAALTLGANRQVTVSANTLTIGGDIGGAYSLTKAGAGTLALSGSNTFSGGLTVNSGHLTINNASALGSGTLTFNNGADTNIHLNVAGSGTIANPISILKPGSARSYNFYQDANTSNAVLAGTIVGNGNSVNFYASTGVTSGTITLTGSNSFGADVWFHKDLALVLGSNYAGGGSTLRFGYDAGGTVPIRITLASGVTIPAGIAADGSGSTQPIYLGMQSSGTTSLTSGFFMLNSTTILRNYYLDTPANAFLSLSSYIYGGALSSLVKTGDGTASLSAASAYTSPVTVSGGVLQVSLLANGGSASALGASSNAASNLTLDGGALRYTGGTVSTDRQFTLTANGGGLDASGSGPVTYSSTAAVVNAGSGNRTLTLTGTNAGANALAAVISDNGADQTSLSKSGVGTWVLTGSNSYSGGTTIASGSLRLGNSNALGTGGLTVNGGSLDFNDNSVSVGALSGTGGSVTNSGGGTSTLTTAVASGTSTYAGNIANGAGAVVLTKTGTGTLVMSGSLTMAGLNANDGVTQLTQSGSIGAVSVAAGATLSMAAHSGSTYNVLDVSSLTLSGSTSTLDLWNNAMIVRAADAGANATNLALVTDRLNAGRDNLAWDGQGINSSTAFNELNNSGVLSLMAYDNSLLDYYFQSSNALGDLNGDGLVDGTDYALIDYGFQTQNFGVLANAGGGVANPAPTATMNMAPVSPEAVPEPGALGLLMAGASALLGIRRRSGKNAR